MGSTPSQVAKLREQMGLDTALWKQFIDYFGGLFQGDLGYAWHTGRPVLDDFVVRFPATVELAIAAILIGLVVGVSLGLLQVEVTVRPPTSLRRRTSCHHRGRRKRPSS